MRQRRLGPTDVRRQRHAAAFIYTAYIYLCSVFIGGVSLLRAYAQLSPGYSAARR